MYIPCKSSSGFISACLSILTLVNFSDTADYIYNHVDALNLNLTVSLNSTILHRRKLIDLGCRHPQGIWLGSPAITNDVIANEVPAVNFVHKYESVFGFKYVQLCLVLYSFLNFCQNQRFIRPNSQSFLAELDSRASSCNYATYMDTHVTYPPPDGPLPLPGSSIEFDEGCDLWSDILSAALVINPAFNIYRIFDMVGFRSLYALALHASSLIAWTCIHSQYPILWDVLGFPYDPQP